jgi:hypothetical protein
VPIQDGRQLADELGCYFIEVLAREDKNVTEAFTNIVYVFKSMSETLYTLKDDEAPSWIATVTWVFTSPFTYLGLQVCFQ